MLIEIKGGKLMKVLSNSFLTLTLMLSLMLLFGAAYAQEKMTMDEYNAQLADWQKREADAKKAAEECGNDVASVKGEIEAQNTEAEKIWKDILAEIGTDEAGVNAFREQLKQLDAQMDGLLALSPEELFKRRDELDKLEQAVSEAKSNRISALTEMQNLIATIEGKIAQARNKMPKAVYDPYTVVVGDYLWKISGKQEIYDDPIQWMRIYSYNKDQINDPDLIFPEQILKIQRGVGPDEYLVAKGDYLAKIAGHAEVLGDPTSWTKVYEKNKDIIGEDPNMIFPYTVLVIPKD